ncbi:ABC transporter permease [Acidovorax sp. A79]|uniref:ABC transporter permease n=1 Tax=Acidovorax sp. A79 TaxID=3056107 RepID=UPI0034E89C85
MLSSETKALGLRILRNRLAFIGVALVSLVVAAALVLPLVLPWDPNGMDIGSALAAPGDGHWLGTDQFGRDLLTRLAYGAGISLQVGLLVTLCSLVLGVALGGTAGYVGGAIDSFLMRAMDALLAFPGLLLALALVAALGDSLWAIVLALTIVGIPRFARVVRATVLQRKEEDYVLAARALGKWPVRILVQDILPNCSGPILIQTTLVFPGAVLGEAALSFLGLGLPPPAPSWGRMLQEATTVMEIAPSMAIYSGLAIFVTVLGFNFLGDGLRDVFDPRTAR